MTLPFVYFFGALIAGAMTLVQPEATPLMLLLGGFMLAGFFVSALLSLFTRRTS